MRRHGSHRRRVIDRTEQLMLNETAPGRPHSKPAPVPEDFKLPHGEVEFAPIDADSGIVDPIDPEPVSPYDASDRPHRSQPR